MILPVELVCKRESLSVGTSLKAVFDLELSHESIRLSWSRCSGSAANIYINHEPNCESFDIGGNIHQLKSKTES